MTKRLLSLVIALAIILSTVSILGIAADPTPIETNAQTGSVVFKENFEDGAKGWALSGNTGDCDASVISADGTDGAKVLRGYDNSKEGTPGATSPYFVAKEGESYTITADMKVLSSTSIRFYIRFLNGSDKILYNSSFTVKSSKWAQAKHVAIAPKGTTKAQIIISGIKTAVGEAYIDNIVVTSTEKGAKISTTAAPSATTSSSSTSGTTSSAPASQGTGETIYKENFESGAKGWTVSGPNGDCDCSIVDADGTDGKKALYGLDKSKEGTPGASSPMIDIKEGEPYTFVADMKTVSGSSLRFYVRYYSKADKVLYNTSFTSKVTKWTQVSHTAVAPKGAVKAQILYTGIKTALGEAYVDNIRIVNAASVPGGSTAAPEATGPVETDEKTGNVVIKESFEGDHPGWALGESQGGNVIEIVSGVASDGSKSVHAIDATKDGTTGANGPIYSVTAGASYTATVDMKVLSGSPVRPYFRFMDDGGKVLYNTSFGTTGSDWTKAKHTAVAPATATKGQIIFSGSKTAVGESYLDNVVVTTNAKVTPVDTSKLYEVKEIPPVKYATEKDLIFSDDFENGLLPHWTTEKTEVQPTVSKDIFNGNGVMVVDDNHPTHRAGIIATTIEVKPEEIYTLTADVYIKSNAMRVYFKYYDEKMNQLTSIYALGGDQKWESVVLYASAPTKAKYLQAAIYTGTTSFESGYIDNFKVYKGYYAVDTSSKPYVAPKQAPAVDAQIVAPVDGKLVYKEYNEKGDKIADFSHAGFYAGDYELPVTANIKVSETLSPTGNFDDVPMIQKAIDKAASEIVGDEMRVVKLKAGRYHIGSAGLKMKTGVILSGEGQGPTGTILYAKDATKYAIVSVAGKEPTIGDKYLITDDYVKSGSNVLNLSDADVKNFKVGDKILIYHPSTEEWCAAMGMQNIIGSQGKDNSWNNGEVDMMTERTITKINGTELTLDFAFFVPYMRDLVPTYVAKMDDSGRVRNVGVENLRMIAYYNGNPDDENHATVGVSIANAENIFVRDITTKHLYMSLVTSSKRAKKVTAVNCSSLDPVSQIAGSRRYTFACSTSAQQILYTGCYSLEGRHDFEASFPVTGPIAFVDNLVDSSHSASEAHGTWSTGLLYDNVYQIGGIRKGTICLINRGHYGSTLSQGWSAAGSVIWNSLSPVTMVHKPLLTYQNFAVGNWGFYEGSDELKAASIKSSKSTYKFKIDGVEDRGETHYYTTDDSSIIGDGYFESMNAPVNPRSLYKAQLAERYTGNITNARPNAPIIVTPKYDEKFDAETVSVTGVYQLGASKVTVYIDNVAYDASMKAETNEFELTTTLGTGTHKIYATQTIDGMEGCKSADRFVIVKEQGENYDYLQSVYSPDKTRMIVNDPRVTYDVIANGVKVNVNGTLLYSDVLPYETQGRVLVPMRAIFERLAANVTWDEATATATATLNGTEVKITENQTTAYVNGNPVILDVPATITNGRFVVPVRFISESFGAKVDWVDANTTVLIEK